MTDRSLIVSACTNIAALVSTFSLGMAYASTSTRNKCRIEMPQNVSAYLWCVFHERHTTLFFLGARRHLSQGMLMWKTLGGLEFRKFIIASSLLQTDGPLWELALQDSVFSHLVYPFNVHLLQYTVCQLNLDSCILVSLGCFPSTGAVKKQTCEYKSTAIKVENWLMWQKKKLVTIIFRVVKGSFSKDH